VNKNEQCAHRICQHISKMRWSCTYQTISNNYPFQNDDSYDAKIQDHILLWRIINCWPSRTINCLESNTLSQNIHNYTMRYNSYDMHIIIIVDCLDQSPAWNLLHEVKIM
jgi:hypothetical protein